VIGATIEPSGDRLILRAGCSTISAALVNRVREAKADLLAALVPCVAGGVDLASDKLRRYQVKDITEGCIVEWLNQHPATSAPGRCLWCGKPDTPSAVVLPFGTEPGTHAWLHAECWAAWHQTRKSAAIAALRENVPEEAVKRKSAVDRRLAEITSSENIPPTRGDGRGPKGASNQPHEPGAGL
jgi:hypothetical protein